MTNSNISNSVLPKDHRCLWQVCPGELPKDMQHNPFALELFQTDKGELHLLQLLVATGLQKPDMWYENITGFVHFLYREDVVAKIKERIDKTLLSIDVVDEKIMEYRRTIDAELERCKMIREANTEPVPHINREMPLRWAEQLRGYDQERAELLGHLGALKAIYWDVTGKEWQPEKPNTPPPAGKKAPGEAITTYVQKHARYVGAGDNDYYHVIYRGKTFEADEPRKLVEQILAFIEETED